MPGVVSTTVGYTGGRNDRPTYESVCGGDGHTEAIQIEYDPSETSYEELLQGFWQGHRPGPSKVQYKSAIWYHDEEQKAVAEAAVKQVGTRYVDIEPSKKWHDAEEYHQKYYAKTGCSVM